MHWDFFPKRTTWREEQSIIWQWRNLKSTTSARWSRPTSTVINHVDSPCAWYDVMEKWRALRFLPTPPTQAPADNLVFWEKHWTNPVSILEQTPKYLTGSFQNCQNWVFPGGPVVKTVLSMQNVQFRSLVRELRFHMLHGKAKKF